MSDDVPEYPPGPRGPEEGVPGPRLRMTSDQVRFISSYVSGVEGASGVQIEDRGAGYLEVTVSDRDGAVINTRCVFPIRNAL